VVVQGVVFGLLLVTHIGPLLQETSPDVHTLLVGQVAIGVQATHPPLEQTPMLIEEVVQGVPSGWLLGTHDGPALHCIAPFVHGLFVGHVAPTVHALQTPAAQTPVPEDVVHCVPSFTLLGLHTA
jgi:hypothetical protein